MKTQSGSLMVIIAVIILLLIVGFGGYYFGTKNKSEVKTTPDPEALMQKTNPEATPEPSSQANGNIPPDWSYVANQSCGVTFPVPPKTEPYTTTKLPETSTTSDNNRYWQLAENTPSSMLTFQNDAILSFIPLEPTELGNDYNPGSVSVFCEPNPNHLTPERVIVNLNNSFKKEQSDFEIIEKGEENKWGLNAKIINFNGGMLEGSPIYLFSANDKTYFVYYSSSSPNQFVKDTAKQIFDNLIFSN